MELQNVNVATQPSLEGAWWLLCEMGHATDNETKAATALVDAVHKRKWKLSSQGRCTSTRVHGGTQSFQSSVGSPCAFWSKRGVTQRCVAQPYVVLYVLRSRVQVELCRVRCARRGDVSSQEGWCPAVLDDGVLLPEGSCESRLEA